MHLVKHCYICDKESRVEVDEETYDLYLWGRRTGQKVSTHGVQVLFSHLTADEREIIISGTHGECYDKAFGGSSVTDE